ncbi:MAG: GGDEF domain-containing protein, partial [Actinobacteria bacterium]|nr:GGDEF domain-containing protein [Actinomycetota bacterium]
TAAVIFLALPTLLEAEFSLSGLNLEMAVRGLVGLVLLFNVYAIWQQFHLTRLRRTLVEQVRAMARLEAETEHWRTLAVVDPLTGLYNRRMLEERMAAEIGRANRHRAALSLLLLDLTDFKLINDRYGHPTGDQVLKEFARLLKKVSRGSDIAVRLGGDEFLLILPECTPENIVHLIARVTKLEVRVGDEKIPVRFAAGWETYRPGETAAELLARADRALYVDKRTQQSDQVLRELNPKLPDA